MGATPATGKVSVGVNETSANVTGAQGVGACWSNRDSWGRAAILGLLRAPNQTDNSSALQVMAVGPRAVISSGVISHDPGGP